MIVVKRGKIIYYVKDEAIIVSINEIQYLSYTVYPLQNRKPFYDFKRTIIGSDEKEYGSAIELIKLSQRFGLKAVASQKPKESSKKS